MQCVPALGKVSRPITTLGDSTPLVQSELNKARQVYSSHNLKNGLIAPWYIRSIFRRL